jgi:GH25 family lysozyme M1 (1,4-beta-N-acetylmuramidase)
MKIPKALLIAAIVLVAVIFLIILRSCIAPDPPNPYEGMILVPDGMGGHMWVDEFEGLDKSVFAEEEFYPDGEYINYVGEGYRALRGIDVSEHQLEIDWQAVKDDGVEFAIIRAGYRGYTEGTLNEDMFFRQNVEGAAKQGLRLGIYFFSQAVNVEEARDEARFLLGLIEGLDITLPVFYDWENIGVDEARTDGITGSEITDFALAFAQTVKDAGYVPGVYFYRSIGYKEYELDRLKELVFWSAAPGGFPDVYYAHTVWQYSFTAKVNGIEPDTDLNIYFEKIPEPDSK